MDNKKDLRREIKARKLVIKKVENAYKRLSQQAENQLNKRKQKVADFQGYGNVESAREAYGCGVITQEEFWEIEDNFEKGEKAILNEISAEELASQILKDFIIGLRQDISSLEFELLPEKEQIKIREKNYEIAMKRISKNNAKENLK